MTTKVIISSVPSMALRSIVHTFVITCLQRSPVLAQVGGQLVVAYGVVGFLRVKDEQKCVLIAEASASADLSAPKHTNSIQILDKGFTNTELKPHKCWTQTMQLLDCL